MLVNFSQFQAATHICSEFLLKLLESGDRPRQPAYEI